MRGILFWMAWLFVVAVFAARAAEPADARPAADPHGPRLQQPAATADGAEVARVAALVDRHLAQAWEARLITPSPLADDAEFLRRVHLDVAGKIPTVSEVRAFLADPSPDKRRAVVEQLLAGPAFLTHSTNVWRGVLLPEAELDVQARVLVSPFDAWLREKLADNLAYDALVRELLTLPLESQAPKGVKLNSLLAPRPSPVAFYVAKQIAPENLAAATARIFLGLRIECAQCHNHPWDTWKREQFWSLAAFFAGLESMPSGQGVFIAEVPDRREIGIPDTTQVVPAAYLDGGVPLWQAGESPRRALATWITARNNPYFARAAANRLWAQFFGRGLVDPVDDFSPNNPPSHPELLDLLACEFAGHDFDLRFLVRALTTSRAYQLTSAQTDAGPSDPRSFGRMAVKRLRPEQLYASLLVALGRFEPFQGQQLSFLAEGRREEFMGLFVNAHDPLTETSTTIVQALALMNGELTPQATNVPEIPTLLAINTFPDWSDEDRIEALYLATVSRPPRAAERQRLAQYLAGQENGFSALADVLWVLLNSSEFMFNH